MFKLHDTKLQVNIAHHPLTDKHTKRINYCLNAYLIFTATSIGMLASTGRILVQHHWNLQKDLSHMKQYMVVEEQFTNKLQLPNDSRIHIFNAS